MARDQEPVTDEEFDELREKMAEQRAELHADLAEDLGGDPEDYRVRPRGESLSSVNDDADGEAVPDGGE
jgi:ribosome-interacting GTPase 1